MLKEYALPDTAPETPGQLFDLEKDPGETTNLAAEHPEIADRLHDLLESSISSGRSRP
jgi:arylsulfatase A-like enzyme